MPKTLKETIRVSLDKDKSKTENTEGGEAFRMSKKTELYERVMTSLMEGKFYDPDSQGTRQAIADLIEQMEKIDPEFPLKLASYARNEMHLRSVPIFIAVEAAKHENMKKLLPKWLPSIIQRADELTEIIAHYIEENGPIGDSKTGVTKDA